MREIKPKVLVIGLDGATFKLIKPLAKEGELPNFARLMREGVYGNLKSSIPPVTYPAWKCYSTGKTPNSLDIYDFFKIDVQKRSIYSVNQTSFKDEEIWDYIGDGGLKVGVMGVPTTYPAKKVNGFMISGEYVTGTDWTYPSSLRFEIEREFNYFPNIKKIEEMLEVENRYRSIEKSFRITEYMIKKEKPDFLQLAIYDTDPLQHRFFENDMRDEEGRYLKEAWKLIDKNVGNLIKLVDKDTTLIFMSDHGFTEIKKKFNINTWLSNNGYLHVDKDYFSLLLSKLGITIDKLSMILKKTRLLHIVRKVVPKKYRERVPQAKGEVSFRFIGDKIDWNKTKAFAGTFGLIYINKSIYSEGFETLGEELIEKIKGIKDPETEEKVIEKVCKAEEVYGTEISSKAPDIVVIPKDGYFLSNVISDREWETHTKWKGTHHMEGIFIANGPEIKEGFETDNAEIHDLAPTILHIFNLPIPKEMDGKVLKEIFKENSEPAKRKVKYCDYERERVKKRIRELKDRKNTNYKSSSSMFLKNKKE